MYHQEVINLFEEVIKRFGKVNSTLAVLFVLLKHSIGLSRIVIVKLRPDAVQIISICLSVRLLTCRTTSQVTHDQSQHCVRPPPSDYCVEV